MGQAVLNHYTCIFAEKDVCYVLNLHQAGCLMDAFRGPIHWQQMPAPSDPSIVWGSGFSFVAGVAFDMKPHFYEGYCYEVLGRQEHQTRGLISFPQSLLGSMLTHGFRWCRLRESELQKHLNQPIHLVQSFLVHISRIYPNLCSNRLFPLSWGDVLCLGFLNWVCRV